MLYETSLGSCRAIPLLPLNAALYLRATPMSPESKICQAIKLARLRNKRGGTVLAMGSMPLRLEHAVMARMHRLTADTLLDAWLPMAARYIGMTVERWRHHLHYLTTYGQHYSLWKD